MRAEKQFVNVRHHETATEAKHRAMLAKLEGFLHAYYDLLEESGGPPNKYDPRVAANEGMDAVEHLWRESLDDDG